MKAKSEFQINSFEVQQDEESFLISLFKRCQLSFGQSADLVVLRKKPCKQNK